MPTEIREYVRRAKADPTTDNIEALWRAVFLLKGWYFVPAERKEGPNRPMVTMLDGEPWLPAFTNVRRYRDFGEDIDRVDDEGEMHLLVLDPGASMEKILDVRDAIRGVVFNPGSSVTFRAPVEALEAYAEHFDVPLGDASP